MRVKVHLQSPECAASRLHRHPCRKVISVFVLEGMSCDLREVSLSRCPLDVRTFQFREPPIVIELLDQETLALMHEDGSFIELEDSSLPFNLFKYLVLSSADIDDFVRLVIRRAYTDMLRWKWPEAIMAVIEAFFVNDQSFFAHLRQLWSKEANVVFTEYTRTASYGQLFSAHLDTNYSRVHWQLESCTLQVCLHDEGIVEVNIQGGIRIREDFMWMFRVVLAVKLIVSWGTESGDSSDHSLYWERITNQHRQ